MDNIKLIDQRLTQLCALIPQSRAHSAAVETRLANEIINLKLKRIEAIQALEKKLGELKGLIKVYKARLPAYEHVLADQIINFELHLISVKSNQPSPNQPASHPPVPHLPAPQPIQSNNIAEIITERPRLIQNLYWQPGQPVGAPIRTFRQIKFLSIPNAVPDLDQALSGARLDCGRDLHKQLIDYGGAAKVWMTVQVSMIR